MSKIDYQALREAAEKATPGRVGDRIDGSGSIKYECHGYDGSLVLRTDHKNMEYGFIGDNSNADELFFRLCVPDVILALLDELEASQELVELQRFKLERQAEDLHKAKSLESIHRDKRFEVERELSSYKDSAERNTRRLAKEVCRLEDELETKHNLVAELSRHLQNAHDFIEHTEAFGYEASNGILCCGDAQWNIDSSKAALESAGSVNGEG